MCGRRARPVLDGGSGGRGVTAGAGAGGERALLGRAGMELPGLAGAEPSRAVRG